MRPRPILAAKTAHLLVLLLAAWAATVQAQTLKDPVLEALYVADRAEELQRAALQRPGDDPQAVLALALAALERNEAPARLKALERAQSCAEKQPRAAPCQYAHGVLLGIQAMSEGMIKAARSAGTVKDALAAAHEIDPAWYPARSALMEFHLMAPGMMGGSASKAAELARTAPKPEQVAALQGRIATQERRFEAALAAFIALPAALEHALAADVRGWGVQAGLGAVNAGQAAKAQPFFERLLREQPGHAAGAYGLARVRGEQGAWAEALRLYERAGALKGAQEWPLAYRTGIALQNLGRGEEAKSAFARFVSAGKGQKASLEDARKRLEQLGG